MVLKHVGVVSCGKMLGAIYLIIGLIAGAIFSLISLLGAAAAPEGHGLPAIFGVGAIVLFPLFYGAIGFIGGIIVAALYNLFAGWLGGIELNLQ